MIIQSSEAFPFIGMSFATLPLVPVFCAGTVLLQWSVTAELMLTLLYAFLLRACSLVCEGHM